MATRRKWDIKNKELQKKCIEEIIARVEEIQDAEVGIIAAQDIIDIVAQGIGPEIYNRGVQDAKRVFQERVTDIEVGMDLLEHHG